MANFGTARLRQAQLRSQMHTHTHRETRHGIVEALYVCTACVERTWRVDIWSLRGAQWDALANLLCSAFTLGSRLY
eukprot:4448507-Amphidinium_carterae.1